MLLEALAIQDMYNRVFLLILYLYLDETRPETRKRPKKLANLCEVKAGEPSRISSDVSRFAYKSFRLQVDSPTSRSFRLHDQVVSPTQFESICLHKSRFAYT